LKKASEYRAHADECRKMAAAARNEYRVMLLRMAETWESLAHGREEQIARLNRIEALTGKISPQRQL
jgi:hypothetical protein